MPSWWAVQSDSSNVEVYRPLLSRHEWDDILKGTDFFGIDSATLKTRNAMIPFSVILTQAVDMQMKMIRRPLTPENSASVQLLKLLIIGGRSESTARSQRDVLTALESFSIESEMKIVDSLEDHPFISWFTFDRGYQIRKID
ncbi:hypothetical protein F4678DRAFT_478688 [Xylaria arbuscula]|nr:hypothetical protein F4678DRAFT_478688 [Xylaria arbuscula]